MLRFEAQENVLEFLIKSVALTALNITIDIDSKGKTVLRDYPSIESTEL